MTTPKNSTKYFIYARKSTESEDRQLESIDDQIEVLQSFAKKRGLNIAEIFSESKSAKAPGRPVFNEMLDRITAGEAKGILCWKLNRLARNPIDGGSLSWMLQNEVISVIQTTDGQHLPTDNVLLMQLEFGVANQYVKDLSKDVKRGLLAKAKKGIYPVTPPLGYKMNLLQRQGEKEVIEDEGRLPAVKKIFELVLSGNHNPKQALKYVTEHMGLRNRKGNAYTNSAVYFMLHNPFYSGVFEYPKDSGQWFEGKHKSIISRQEYKKIQELINPDMKTNFSSSLGTINYRGTVYCLECRRVLTSESKNKTLSDGTTRTYTYYHCARNDPRICLQTGISETELEKQYLQFLKSVQINNRYYKWELGVIERVEKDALVERKSHFNSVDDKLKAVNNKLEMLVDLRISEKIDENTYDSKRADLEKKKFDLERESVEQPLVLQEKFDRLRSQLDQANSGFSTFPESSKERKRDMLGENRSNFFVHDKKLVVKQFEGLSIFKNHEAAYERLSNQIELKKPLATNDCVPSEGENLLMCALEDELRNFLLN